MRTFLKYWLPVFIWIAIILAGSTDIFSAERTSRYLVPFLRWLNPHISPHTIATIHFALRKLGHLTEYAILATLLWRALRSGNRWQVRISILFVVAWFVCAIFAATDEFHQSFVPSRTAAAGDVMIDIVGAFIGLAICWIFARRENFVSAAN
jgi:VanZ family protein